MKVEKNKLFRRTNKKKKNVNRRNMMIQKSRVNESLWMKK